jgi:hypothetical protein
VPTPVLPVLVRQPTEVWKRPPKQTRLAAVVHVLAAL